MECYEHLSDSDGDEEMECTEQLSDGEEMMPCVVDLCIYCDDDEEMRCNERLSDDDGSESEIEVIDPQQHGIEELVRCVASHVLVLLSRVDEDRASAILLSVLDGTYYQTLTDRTITRCMREACAYRAQVRQLQVQVRQQERSLELSALLANQERQQLQHDQRRLLPQVVNLQQRAEQLEQRTVQLRQRVQQLQQYIQRLQQRIQDQDQAQDHMVAHIAALERQLQDVRHTSYLCALVFTNIQEQRQRSIATIIELIRSAREVIYLCMYVFTNIEIKDEIVRALARGVHVFIVTDLHGTSMG